MRCSTFLSLHHSLRLYLMLQLAPMNPHRYLMMFG